MRIADIPEVRYGWKADVHAGALATKMLSLVKRNDRIAVRADATTHTARVAAISDFQLYGRAIWNIVDGSLVTLLDNKMTGTAETAMTGISLMEQATTCSSLRAQHPVSH